MRQGTRFPRWVTLVSTASVLGACTGYITPGSPPPAPPGSTGVACPTVPAAVPASGPNSIRIAGASLTCGGNGTMAVATSPSGSSGTRFVVQLSNGSTYSATVYPVNALNLEGIGVPVTITFGVTYTGDQGVETTAAGTSRPCIVQSGAAWSQFQTSDPVISLFEGTVKDQIHLVLDNAVINQVFLPAGSSPVPGRCARWRTL
jgi:hypothetical protein